MNLITKSVFRVIVLGFVSVSINSQAQQKNNDFYWSEDETHVALLKDDRIIWQFNFDKANDKPYFHPLRTPMGLDMTLERPADHPWHRGLWFSWKSINGVNYWEENRETGHSAGRSLIKKVKSKLGKKDAHADIRVWMEYSDSGKARVTELRHLEISAPENGRYLIKWDHEFDAKEDVTLYLEKPAKHGGVAWGGYAGLSYRGSDQLRHPTFFASGGWTNQQDLTGYGEKERWMGIVAKNNNTDVSLFLFDHPGNVRYPSPWYIWYAEGHNLFFTPSFLFDGPLLLKKGQKLRLRYGVWVADGKVTTAEIEKQFSSFSHK